MRRVHIDFGQPPRHRRRLAYLCLGLQTLIFVLSFVYYQRTLGASASLIARRQADHEPRGQQRTQTVTSTDAEELTLRRQAAQIIVERLSIPWATLFDALEDATAEDVAVLRVEPDVSRREVRITVETDKISRAVAYAHSLQTTGALTDVFIASQREGAMESTRNLQVVIAGTWAAVPQPLHLHEGAPVGLQAAQAKGLSDQW